MTFVNSQNIRTSFNYYITSMAVFDLPWVATNWLMHLEKQQICRFWKNGQSDFARKLGNCSTTHLHFFIYNAPMVKLSYHFP